MKIKEVLAELRTARHDDVAILPDRLGDMEGSYCYSLRVMPGWMQAVTLTCLSIIVLFFFIIIDDMVRDYIKEGEKKAEDMRRREEDAAYRR